MTLLPLQPLAIFSYLRELNSYTQAITYTKWQQVMKVHLDALEANKTWGMVPYQKHKKPIASKWVYRIKYKSDGTVDKLKARLVAKSFNQLKGVDYTESFAFVANLLVLGCFLPLLMLKFRLSTNWT